MTLAAWGMDADTHGWNKAARLQEQRRKQIRDRRPPVLEPSFPWRADPFPAEFFGITAPPPSTLDASTLDASRD